MDKKQFYRDRLFISMGPEFRGRVMIEGDNETLRLATDDEMREAATFISWIQEYAKNLSSDNDK